MLNETVQLKAEARPKPELHSIVGYKNGRPVMRGRVDTTPEGIVRGCQRITELAIRAEREGWPGW